MTPGRRAIEVPFSAGALVVFPATDAVASPPPLTNAGAEADRSARTDTDLDTSASLESKSGSGHQA